MNHQTQHLPFSLLGLKKVQVLTIVICFNYCIKFNFHSAPDVIIYDNACNLHAYCLNRNPKFFQKTRFLADRFHWPNHTGMSYHNLL